jgi:3-hydroxypropanoate dehydrogenase
MGTPVSAEALDTLFRTARSYSGWLPKPVADDTIRELYEILKLGPTGSPYPMLHRNPDFTLPG